MKSNALLKWLMIPVVLVVVYLGFKLFSGRHDPASAPPSPSSAGSPLTAAEMKTLRIEGDTPRDTVATLVGEVKDLRSELKAALSESKEQKTATERLRQRDSSIEQRIQAALNSERERSRQDQERAQSEQRQTQSLLQELQQRLDAMRDKTGHGDLPVGLGLQEGDAESFSGEHLRWVEPQDARPKAPKAEGRAPSAKTDFQFPSSFEPAADRAQSTLDVAAEKMADASRDVSGHASLKPVFTIPANATLTGSVAMTALIGRVPVQGTVNDPYQFKVIVGADNLTANGMELPEVVGAVMSGTASGDWNLSCVRGQIRSITFVFDDGTVRSVPGNSSSNGDAGNDSRGDLGWISDPYGIPCVSGERHSNAKEYLTSQMLITAAGAGAASIIDSSGSASFISGSNGTALGTVGITGNEAMERILAGGVNEMSQWVQNLYGQVAAVYVKPTAKVAVHIERPIEIDYDPNGRKVAHRAGDIHGSALD